MALDQEEVVEPDTYGTTLVAVVLRDGILVGYDSRRTHADTHAIWSDEAEKLCNLTGNIQVTRAGHLGSSTNLVNAIRRYLVFDPHASVADLAHHGKRHIRKRMQRDEAHRCLGSAICFLSGVTRDQPQTYALVHEYAPPTFRRDFYLIDKYAAVGSGAGVALKVLKKEQGLCHLSVEDASKKVALALLNAALYDKETGGNLKVKFVSVNEARETYNRSVIESYHHFFPCLTKINMVSCFIIYKADDFYDVTTGEVILKEWFNAEKISYSERLFYPLTMLVGAYYIQRVQFQCSIDTGYYHICRRSDKAQEDRFYIGTCTKEFLKSLRV